MHNTRKHNILPDTNIITTTFIQIFIEFSLGEFYVVTCINSFVVVGGSTSVRSGMNPKRSIYTVSI